MPQPPSVQELLRKATRLCQEVLVIDTEHGVANYGLGFCLGECGDEQASLTAFRAAVTALPQFAVAHCSSIGINLGRRREMVGAEALPLPLPPPPRRYVLSIDSSQIVPCNPLSILPGHHATCHDLFCCV